MKLLLCASLVIGLALAAPGPQPCTTQTIKVNSQWSLPSTPIAGGQYCQLTFLIPSDSFALVDVSTKDASTSDSIYIADTFGETIGKMMSAGVWNSSLAWPGNVVITVGTPKDTTLQLEIKLTLKKATPQSNVVGRVTTSSNSRSTLIYYNDWVEGSSYVFISQASNIVLQTADTEFYTADRNAYANVHVYDGTQLVGSLLSVSETNNFVSKTNKITLYLAKKFTLRGAVMVTDYSNVKHLASHYLVYAPVETTDLTAGHLVAGDKIKAGSLTIVGDKDGTPLDVFNEQNLDDLMGVFSVISGGPVASHSHATPLPNAGPHRLIGNLNTVYISRGSGNVMISIAED